MEGEESFEKFSPEVRLKDPIVGKAASMLPPIMLFHGSSDYSIPCDARYLIILLRSHALVISAFALLKPPLLCLQQNFCRRSPSCWSQSGAYFIQRKNTYRFVSSGTPHINYVTRAHRLSSVVGNYNKHVRVFLF